MPMRKRKIAQAEIPTSSMADIAFLLLLFFLVATVIDVDTGIGLTLPQYVKNPNNIKVPKDRMAAILINANGDVLLDENPIAMNQIKDALKTRIESKIDLPADKKLIVSVKTDRKTDYNTYVEALDQIKQAYFETRDEYSESQYGSKFKELTDEQSKVVKDKIPIIISLAEPNSSNK
jgi:biopolymer transport protein ExbD